MCVIAYDVIFQITYNKPASELLYLLYFFSFSSDTFDLFHPGCTMCASQLHDVFDPRPKTAAHASGCSFKQQHLSFHWHRVLLALSARDCSPATAPLQMEEARAYYAKVNVHLQDSLLPVSKEKKKKRWVEAESYRVWKNLRLLGKSASLTAVTHNVLPLTTVYKTPL